MSLQTHTSLSSWLTCLLLACILSLLHTPADAQTTTPRPANVTFVDCTFNTLDNPWWWLLGVIPTGVGIVGIFIGMIIGAVLEVQYEKKIERAAAHSGSMMTMNHGDQHLLQEPRKIILASIDVTPGGSSSGAAAASMASTAVTALNTAGVVLPTHLVYCK